MVSAGEPVIDSGLIVIEPAVEFITNTGRPLVLPTWVFENTAGLGEIKTLPVTAVPVIGTVIVPATSVGMLSVDVMSPDVVGWNRTMKVQDVCPPCPDGLNVAGHDPPATANGIG